MRNLLFVCLVVCACSGTSLPKDVLPKDKMEAVLYDVIRADEMVDFLRLNDSTYQLFSRRTALYDSIFQLHRVEKDVFRKSMTFYQGRPDLLKDIIDGMYKRVSDTTGKSQPYGK